MVSITIFFNIFFIITVGYIKIFEKKTAMLKKDTSNTNRRKKYAIPEVVDLSKERLTDNFSKLSSRLIFMA